MNSRPARTMLLVVLLALLVEGTLLFVSPIPAWNTVRWFAVLAVFLVFLVSGIWLLVRAWSAASLRKKIVLTSALLAGLVGIAFGVWLGILTEAFGFFLLQEIRTPEGEAIYLYEHGCFPPDSRAECDYYSSEIRHRLFPLPVTRDVYRCDCLFGESTVANGVAELPIEKSRAGKKGTVRIDVDKGEVLDDG